MKILTPANFAVQLMSKLTLQEFKDLLEKHKACSVYENNIYAVGVSMEFEPFHKLINQLFNTIFTPLGYDWIQWYIYESHYGEKKMEAWDENKTPICQDVESLYEYLNKNNYIKL